MKTTQGVVLNAFGVRTTQTQAQKTERKPNGNHMKTHENHRARHKVVDPRQTWVRPVTKALP